MELNKLDKFIIKQYENEKPIIKGNGFDGLEIGDDRQEAEEFISFVNFLIDIVNKYNITIQQCEVKNKNECIIPF